MNVQVLVFDLDGTLIDTMGDYADQAAALICDRYGTSWAEARRGYFETSGLPFEQQLEQLFPGEACNDEVSRRFESWKDGYLLNASLPFETTELLRGWRNEGFRVAISSNNLESYVQRLAKCWPVDAALGYRAQDGFGKGEPHFQKLEELFGFAREQMLFIGDSPNDARIAALSRVPFCVLLTREFAEADFSQYSPGVQCIAKLSELNASLQDSRLIGAPAS
ncbi:MAG: haloacid dehalogenase-like hydrolase [Acidobacteriota bacterium]